MLGATNLLAGLNLAASPPASRLERAIATTISIIARCHFAR
jgi:hypothetical protein